MNNILKILSQLNNTETFALILLALLGAFVFVFIAMSTPESKAEHRRKKAEQKLNKKNEGLMTRISDGSLSNKFTSMSFMAPFKWFIDDMETSKQAISIKKKIADAQLYYVFTYRSFTVVKFIFALFGVTLLFVLLFFINNASKLFPILNLADNNLIEAKVFVLFFCGFLSFFPSFQLTSKAKFIKSQRTKDLPILQLFLILSLRTGRSIKEIFETLGNLNTKYDKTFKTAFLIHMRSEKDCFAFLLEEFKDTSFEFTIRALSNMAYYKKADTIMLLENSLEDIITENKSSQEKKNLINLFLTQGTLALPLISIGLLLLYPIVSYVMAILNATTF